MWGAPCRDMHCPGLHSFLQMLSGLHGRIIADLVLHAKAGVARLWLSQTL